MTTYIFDIETGPRPANELALVLPAFDPEEVKLGNIKDPIKRAAKIEEAAANHKSDQINRAALDAISGQVLAIGVMDAVAAATWLMTNEIGEADLLRSFWKFWSYQGTEQPPYWIGHNVKNFDLPFLVRRSWHHNIPLPYGLRQGRYWSQNVIDTMEEYALGEYGKRISLDNLARFFGVKGKSGSGKDFHLLWIADRKAALAYLEQDLQCTCDVAHRMGLVRRPAQERAEP